MVMRGMNKISCIEPGFIGGHMADDVAACGQALWQSVIDKNNTLLWESNKDVDLLTGIYGGHTYA